MRGLMLTCFLILSYASHAQIDHWESVVLEGQEYQYILPTSEPPANWTTLDFDDNDWETGISGIGYGDSDDATVISPTISVFMRTKFEIIDLSNIEEALLDLDFDDGFAAYINGTKIAQMNLGIGPVYFDSPSTELHEASLYRNGIPDQFSFDKNLLNQGENILAIQVHNSNISSSDLTAIPFLSLGIKNNNYSYAPTPSWFFTTATYISTRLPIVRINKLNDAINQWYKVPAAIEIVSNEIGAENFFNATAHEYKGICSVKFRGESSLNFDKKSLGVEMQDNFGNDIDTSFLGFSKEEDFIFYGPYSDKTLINNILAMKLGNELGHYASQTRLVELVLDGNYHGIYVMMEKIKRDKHRVDIAKLSASEINGDDLTGGYIFRIDKGDNEGWFSEYNVYDRNEKLFYQYYYPDQDQIQPEQKSYIKDYVDQFERAIASDDGIHPNGKHYTEYINLRSFIDIFIVNELSKNVDAYRLSSYFHKDKDSKGGKIIAGPLWDFNLAFGNGDYCQGDNDEGFLFYQCTGHSPFWWDSFLNDPIFTSALRCRWESIRANILEEENLNYFIDSTAVALNASSRRNFTRWPILGEYIWPNPQYFIEPTSHAAILEVLKQWLSQRIIWLDEHLPGVAENCELYDEDYEFTTTVNEPTEHKSETSFFPNPTSSGITIHSTADIKSVTIINHLGQRLYTEVATGKIHYLNLSGVLIPGNYIVGVQTAEGTYYEGLTVR